MAKDQKQVRVHVSRKITLERHEKDPVVMHAGYNTVDADVAEHPFVKAHMSEPSEDAAGTDAALLARAEAAEAKVAELEAVIAAFQAADVKKK